MTTPLTSQASYILAVTCHRCK